VIIKQGVIHEGVHWRIGYVLAFADAIWKKHGRDLAWTAGKDGKHKVGSLHYLGRAADLRTRYFSAMEAEEVAVELRKIISRDYDVVVHSTHIHVEYDPKGGS